MATILLDCKGVLLVDYLPHKTTMTGPYYSELLKKPPGIYGELEGNAHPMSTAAARQCTGAHVSSCMSRIVKDIGVEQLSHPPYSTDLTPSDLYLFQHLKKHLRGKRFCDDDDEVKRVTESYLDSMPQEFYLTGLRGLFSQCLNCADVKGVTIEQEAKLSLG